MKIRFLWLALAALCIIYGCLVLRTGSGTGFFAVWFFLGAFFIFCAWFSWKGLWQKIPFTLHAVILVLFSTAVLFFIYVEGKILTGFKNEPENNLDYIVVLGAQVYESGPSAVLKYRLDRALEYLEDNPDTVCIVTGAQGWNEPFPESKGMRDYLLSKGIDDNRIITEDMAENTRQNLEYSSAFFDAASDRVGIVTNDFHMYRALRIAERAGITHAYGVPAASTPLYLPNNMLREFFAVVVDFVSG